MKENREKLEKILATYLEELEAARNTQSKADALIVLREHLTNMIVLADYMEKTKHL